MSGEAGPKRGQGLAVNDPARYDALHGLTIAKLRGGGSTPRGNSVAALWLTGTAI